jgi:chemotaxis protein MotB
MKHNKAPIIIKKNKKEEEHGSHGAWKIAYADFMTAMMAFFLMMWLTSSVSENVRRGISTYFAAIGASTNIFGTDALLEGGENLEILGNLQNTTLENQIFPDTPVYDLNNPNQGEGDSSKGLSDIKPSEDAHGLSNTINDNLQVEQESQSINTDASNEAKTNLSSSGTEGGAASNQGTNPFKATLALIKEAIEQDPKLIKFKDNIVTQILPDGLKIELIDKKNMSMFEVGSSVMLPQMKLALAKIARILSILPHHVDITGHTDARSGLLDGKINWDLSASRALAARSFLVESGYPVGRIDSVIAKGSRDLFDTKNPLSPSNRRISITVLGVDPKKNKKLPAPNKEQVETKLPKEKL